MANVDLDTLQGLLSSSVDESHRAVLEQGMRNDMQFERAVAAFIEVELGAGLKKSEVADLRLKMYRHLSLQATPEQLALVAPGVTALPNRNSMTTVPEGPY